MKMDIAKVKPVAGFFLEGLMLVFIFVYAQSDFTSKDTEDELPLKSMTSFNQLAFIGNPSSGAFFKHFSRHQLPSGELTILAPIDVPGLEIGLSDALSVSHSERNNFYVLLTDHAP
jgi:hypothetical protein